MTPERPVLIVGAGIGGLALALALARRGIASRIVERRQELAEAGAGIQLSPNAVRVLQELGVALPLAPAVGVPGHLAIHAGRTGSLVQRLPLGDWIAARHGAPYWVAHRRDLQAVLATAVAAEPLVRLTLGVEVRFFEAEGRIVRLAGPGGQRIEGAAIVGADGVFSRIRQQLLAPKAPRWSGLTAARTVIPADRLGNRLDISSTGVWLGRRTHVVHYPVRAGREVAVVVIAPGRTAEQGWAVEATRESVLASVRGFAPDLGEVLATATEWRRWALYELEPLTRWSGGRVGVLGDAAHPTLPFLAQGGALALEDAAVLARRLAEAGEHHVDEALAAYGAARSARAARIVAAARGNGRLFHLPGLLARARDLALARTPPARLMARWDWVYGWRPD